MKPEPNLCWTRRAVLKGMSAAVAACMLGHSAAEVRAEPPPETTTVRLLFDPEIPVLCYGPMILAREFLQLEGFTDVRYVAYRDAWSDTEVLRRDEADFAAALGSDVVFAIDQGVPITTVGGLHAGCVEMFASDRVANIRDLAGKRIVATAPRGPEHIFLSAIVAFVGLDPDRDVEWVFEPNYGKWPELLVQGKVDVVNAFPPQNLVLREMGVGKVILNTTLDEPWRNFFCCMFAGRTEFVRRYPVATKRVVRALVKANQLCESDPEGTAKRFVEGGATEQIDYARRLLDEVPYGAWRDFDPRDTIRFHALRLNEAGLLKRSLSDIMAAGTDFSFLDQVRRELKT